jgi:hypothetical protein
LSNFLDNKSVIYQSSSVEILEIIETQDPLWVEPLYSIYKDFLQSYLLAWVVSIDSGFAHGFNWKNTDTLELIGEQKLEWENYVRGLKHSSLVLSDERDKIVWT